MLMINVLCGVTWAEGSSFSHLSSSLNPSVENVLYIVIILSVKFSELSHV